MTTSVDWAARVTRLRVKLAVSLVVNEGRLVLDDIVGVSEVEIDVAVAVYVSDLDHLKTAAFRHVEVLAARVESALRKALETTRDPDFRIVGQGAREQTRVSTDDQECEWYGLHGASQ